MSETSEVVSLIDQLIREHQQIFASAQAINDAAAMLELDKAKDKFVPGRLVDHQQGLQKLAESLQLINTGLEAHFKREETSLLVAFEKHGGKTLVSALQSLLLEHDNLRERFVHAKKKVAELTGGEMSRHTWEASAHDMRAHLTHTLKLLTTHAHAEQELFHKLRAELAEHDR